MSASSVPVPTFGPTGFVIPAEADILAGIIADTNAALGGNANPGLTTPQGQLSMSQAAIVSDANDQFLYLSQQFDPALSSGRWQDGLGYIYFLTRIPAQSTVVQATCVGLAGVVIPVGALAKATDNNIYVCTTAGTIPLGGSITLPFACQTTGPIPCPAGTLTKVYQSIPGWDTITNAADGVIGNAVESQFAFEQRRALSVALNSVGKNDAILGAVLNVPGVLDAYVIDNPTNAGVTIGGQSIAANSLYVAAVGGNSLAVATAIWTKKPPGIPTVGSTSQTVSDPNPLYQSPPTYAVNFQIPASLPIYMIVSIASSSAVPANALTLIQNAVLTAFAGADGGSRARIGSELFALRYYAGIAALGPWANVVAIQIGSRLAVGATIVGSISGTTLTVASTSTGAIAVGQFLEGANVIEGTRVVSGSGATWVVSIGQTAASGTIYGVLPALNDLTAQINQVPTIIAANIALVLV